ncbi:MAG: hypothetical protein LQ343_005206 [Gyalolechia ehrenbergii]|nr:MAG: hypothetical protein LQ343_005206 [Gyalolechia ehrenbergii]
MRSASLGQLTNHDFGGKGLLDGSGKVDPWLQRDEGDTQSSMAKNVAVDVRPKRKRMLTLEEMLNPIDGKPAPRESEDTISSASSFKSLDVEASKTLDEEDKGGKKPRVAKEIRRRFRGRGERKSKQYAVMRMKL